MNCNLQLTFPFYEIGECVLQMNDNYCVNCGKRVEEE